MNSTDPASLQNLNDIVIPPDVSWWPLAPGWYVVAAILLLLVVWFIFRSLRHRKDNRYRITALREFRTLAEDIRQGQNPDTSLRQIPGLLKRTALSAYPRNEVASLHGEDWHRFLNSTVPRPAFSDSDARTLEQISYSTGSLDSLGMEKITGFLNASGAWLRDHVPPGRANGGKG